MPSYNPRTDGPVHAWIQCDHKSPTIKAQMMLLARQHRWTKEEETASHVILLSLTYKVNVRTDGALDLRGATEATRPKEAHITVIHHGKTTTPQGKNLQNGVEVIVAANALNQLDYRVAEQLLGRVLNKLNFLTFRLVETMPIKAKATIQREMAAAKAQAKGR